MPWAKTRVEEERIKFVIRASQDSVNLSALCREFGISRWIVIVRLVACQMYLNVPVVHTVLRVVLSNLMKSE